MIDVGCLAFSRLMRYYPDCLCERRIAVITRASQARDEGSTPFARLVFNLFQTN